MDMEAGEMNMKVTVSPAQEVLIKNEINNAIEMILALPEKKFNEIDINRAYKLAYNGIIEGAAADIIYGLGHKPCYKHITEFKGEM